MTHDQMLNRLESIRDQLERLIVEIVTDDESKKGLPQPLSGGGPGPK